jgi:hypothetical protein
MSDISLLPEEMRGKEELKKDAKQPAGESGAGGLRMHVPEAEADEDIEIIEVDEGDLASVLADEPLMTRLTYKLSSAIDRIRGEIFSKKDVAPPAKVPPQFFKPPKPGLVSKPGAPALGQARTLGMPQTPSRPLMAGGTGVPTMMGGAPASAARVGKPGEQKSSGVPRARIMPQADVPRRVRVIRRVRKPVLVSLISSRELAALTVDVSKRKWTLSVVVVVFAVTLTGARIFLNGQVAAAKDRRASVQTELASTRAETDKRLKTWSLYEDLQNRLELLDGALKRHIIVTRLFDFLETRTLPTVSYRSASWSSEGNLSLDIVTDSFESAARQLVAFKESRAVKKAEATSFAISGGTAAAEGQQAAPATVSFQIVLELDPMVFQNPALTPADAVPVTAAATGTPSNP